MSKRPYCKPGISPRPLKNYKVVMRASSGEEITLAPIQATTRALADKQAREICKFSSLTVIAVKADKPENQ